jgi:hypothetical protein
MSQDLAFQQGASELQTFGRLKKKTSPLRIHFVWLIPTELHHLFFCLTLHFNLLLALVLI